MIREEPVIVKEYPFIISKVRDYAQLMKPNLSFMVVFSSVIGYLLVPGIAFSWPEVITLFVGGILVTNGANIINQIIERHSDAFMRRTRVRPLPCNRMSVSEAWLLVIVSTGLGVYILGHSFNWLAAGLSFLSLLLYGFAYTPMKKKHPIATFIGAIPGAFPPLIGWVAATGSLTGSLVVGGWVLFAIQFFWQFPHFWAIAWLGYDEYLKAGIDLLPSRQGRTSATGLQCIFYSLPLIPLVMVPYAMHLTGQTGMWISVACGLFYTFNAYMFFRKNNKVSAKRLLYSSFLYLPVVLLALVIDKI